MPMYQYSCEICKVVRDEFRLVKGRNKKVKCGVCGHLMSRDITLFMADTFKPITLEHINVEGEGALTFDSRKKLQSYCTKHGLVCGALRQI